MFSERTIYILMITGFLSSIPCFYFLIAFKIYGQFKGHDDEMLSILGFVAIFISGFGRLGWATILARLKFRYTVIL